MREPVDTRTAQSLEEILNDLDECEYVTLSLKDWRERSNELLTDEKAAATVLLFDRDFHREEEGAEHEGFNLIREVQVGNVGYCGLISHTIPLGSEYDAWKALSSEHHLDREKLVVIAKERLTGESPDYYQFFRTLRFVALNGRYATVKLAAWSIFQESIEEAKTDVEDLSVFDFDRIVFASSHREGVWELDTLFRVFGILMRRKAQKRLRQDNELISTVAEARRISTMPYELSVAIGEEEISGEALRIQRFESYESTEDLNRFHIPIEVGDIFRKISTGRQYILLAQPCDLMVRPGGRRSYECSKYGRTATLVELVVDPDGEDIGDRWGELPFYCEETGGSAFANFAKVHQARIAVLDLCVFQADGIAKIDLMSPCPELLIEPWKARYDRLEKLFAMALKQYETLESKGLKELLKSLALPRLSTTVEVRATVAEKEVTYDLERVMRLRQPWSGALLTALAHYQARAAFEHPLPQRPEADEGD